MGSTRMVGGLVAVLLVVVAWPAWGQRIRMPSAIPLNVATPSVASRASATSPTLPTQTTTTYAPGTSAGQAPSASGSVSGAYPLHGNGDYSPTTTYAPPTTFAPPGTYAPSNGYTTTPPGAYAPGALAPPGAGGTFQGGIQPAPGWDPYGLPGAQQPTLLPQDPYLPSTPMPYPGGTIATMTRFLQETRLDYVFIPGTASNELGINSFDLSATFAVPFFYNTQYPLLVTPGFGLHLWNGPETLPGFPGYLPPRTYDAYLDVAWNPLVNQVIGAELGFRIGVHSDFEEFVEESLRLQGHGLVVLSLSPSIQLKAGVVYLDRVDVKFLPAGGVVWTPNPDVRFEILFPNPRLAWRLWTYGNADWWMYVRGEYGGGSWTIEQVDLRPGIPPERRSYVDQFDYNDIRIGVGLEFDTPSSWKGLFETGIAFEREVLFNSGFVNTFRPDPMVYLRAALAY